MFLKQFEIHCRKKMLYLSLKFDRIALVMNSQKKIYRIINATLISLCMCFSMHAQPKVIAHRGYWKTEGSAQNSIRSLLKADSIGVYGSEVDIWLSADGIPVVNHDATVVLNGKKLTVEETTTDTLKQVKLANGESLPTFEAYLDAFVTCQNTKLIVEFKTHKKKAHEDELAARVIQMVRNRHLQNKVEYISFGKNFVEQVRKLDPEAKIYYLNGDLTPAELSTMGAAGLDYHYNVLYRHPEWVKQAHEKGLKVNVWTVNSSEDIQKVIDLGVDFITTDEPETVKQKIEEL
jgi:glycerophosphoryl diester phosphodiesterase